MLILYSEIFKKYPEIIFGFSTKKGNAREAPYYFNMSLSVGDNEEKVLSDRKDFFSALGLKPENVALQKQIHADKVVKVESGGLQGESDAMVTNRPGIGIAISTADCANIYLYDFKNRVIAGVHSGWRGSLKKILQKTLQNVIKDFNSSAENIAAYIGPSISQQNYEIGKEVAELFDKKYLKLESGEIFLDVTGVNYDILIHSGIKKENIEVSPFCSFEEKETLHSYRRDGLKSGRSLGIISLKE